ncbi:MAG: hypothetical protein ACRBB2_08895, partial [Nitrosopumilus sp.]
RQVTREPVETTDHISELYEIVEKIAKQADIKISPTHRYATSGLCNILQDKPMIGSMGPVGADYRTPNEHILKDSLIDRGVLLALVLNKLSSSHSSNGKTKN